MGGPSPIYNPSNLPQFCPVIDYLRIDGYSLETKRCGYRTIKTSNTERSLAKMQRELRWVYCDHNVLTFSPSVYRLSLR